METRERRTIELWIGPIRVSGKATAFEWVERIYKGAVAGTVAGVFLFSAAATVYGLIALAAKFGFKPCGG